MSRLSILDGLAEVRGAVAADPAGHAVEALGPAGAVAEADLAAARAATASLSAAGAAVQLAGLEMVLVKGTRRALATAVRPDGLLLVAIDPFRPTAAVERALRDWIAPGAAPPSLPPPPPAPEAGAAAPAPDPRGDAPAASPGAAHWADLRRALVHGQLTEAAALQRLLAPGPVPGAEPLPDEEREAAVRLLLEGIGSVLAGDALGGTRSLQPLAAEAQPNLSIRWLALHWSARAAVRTDRLRAARTSLQGALALAQQLDVEARAVTCWTAAEVLARGGDRARALAWLDEARGRFERIGDGWGLARTWLAQARVHATDHREAEAADAARLAAERDPAWDEPSVFLAHRALIREDVAGAEALVAPLRTPAADRVRRLIDSIREGAVTGADAAEYLREHDAPPSERSLQILLRIIASSPRFLQAREALAWMLLRVGRYGEAATIFRGLLGQPLSSGERVSVTLGLGCIANAQRAGQEPEASLQAAVSASALAAPAGPPGRPATLPPIAAASLLDRISGTGTAGLEAVFSGQLSVFALPDLLEFLRSARRTGLLVCSAEAGMGIFRFREGKITGAVSPATPHLGAQLVAAGTLAPEALAEVTAARPGAVDQALGAELVARGLVATASVRAALEDQVELAMRELLAWSDGQFAFNREGEGPPTAGELAIEVDPQEVLLGILTEQDEARRGAPPSAPPR